MNNGCHEFYYEMMDMNERAVYRAMYDGLKNFESSFVIIECEYGKIAEIFEKLIDDHPDIFYVDNIGIKTRGIHSGYRIMPKYRFSIEEVNYLIAEVNNEIKPLVNKCIGLNVFDAEKILHDYLVNKSTYKDADAPYSHEMPGVFLYGIGVCEGMAKAFKYLCDNLEIHAGIVVGNTKEEIVAHAWNQICLDGEWYNVDITFDANLTKSTGDVRYDYFNVTDSELTDRTSFFKVHSCNKHYGFYERNHKYAKCQNDLRLIMSGRTENVISVQLPQLNCSEECLQEYILKTVSDGIQGTGKYEIKIWPNYDMNVFTINVERCHGE